MSAVSLFLVTIAAIFLIGVIGELVFEKTGIPDVVWLIVVGILLGPIFGLVERAELQSIAPYFGAVTLVIVLFDGGSGLRLKELSHAAPRAAILALVGFVTSVGLLAAGSMGASRIGLLPESWTWLHGVILGAILGGSSSVVIMPALAKAGLDARVSNLVNLESALTDVLCVVVTAAAIRIAVSGATDVGEAAATLGKAFGIGLGVGVGAGLLALLALQRLRRSRHAYPLMLGTLLALYVGIDALGGSAALGILVVAILVGNAPALSKVVGLVRSARLTRRVENAHDQITFIVKSFFFVFIGAMLGPPWGLLLLGVLLGLVLLAGRVPAVLATTLGAGLSPAERGLVTVSMPRGMAAGVLAMMPSQEGVADTDQLPVAVFAAVLTTILLFAVGFPFFRRSLVSPVAAQASGEGSESGAPPPEGSAPPSSHGGEEPPPSDDAELTDEEPAPPDDAEPNDEDLPRNDR